MESNKDDTENKSETVDINGTGIQDVENAKAIQVDDTSQVYKDRNNKFLFEVKVSGLPRFYPLSEFKRLVKEELGLALRYIRCPKRGNPWLYLSFNTAEEQKRAIKSLHKFSYRQCTLSCNIISNEAQKRKPEAQTVNDAKKVKLDMSVNDRVLWTLPYYNIPYEEQLKKKTLEIKSLVLRVGELVVRHNPELAGWAEQQKKKNSGVVCTIEEIRPSPVVDGYRNKCEYRVGLNPDTQERTVGCRVTSRNGTVGVGSVDSLRHLPDQMKEALKLFQDYIRQSDKEPFSSETQQGYWRHFTVRISCDGDMMITVIIHPQSLTDNELMEVKNDLREYFLSKKGNSCNIISLYFQTLINKLPAVRVVPKLELLFGETYLKETLFDLTFYLSPACYFQVNTKGAEVLYSTIMELVQPTEETTILDLCCGTGGIGLCIARKCKDVFGIEYLARNVEDAEYIAAKNNITNCEFITGRVEDTLLTLKDKLKDKKIVTILDPPRNGLTNEVFVQLRQFDNITKLVYVCPSNKAPIKNFLDLCCAAGNNSMTGRPFVPVKIIPVDTVPHTVNAQMVILLERVDPQSFPKPKKHVDRNIHRKTAGNKGIEKRRRSPLLKGHGEQFINANSRNFSSGNHNVNYYVERWNQLQDRPYNFNNEGRWQSANPEISMINVHSSMRGNGIEMAREDIRNSLTPSLQPVRRTLLSTPLYDGSPPQPYKRPPLLKSPLLPSYGVDTRCYMDFSSEDHTPIHYSEFSHVAEDAIDHSFHSDAMRYHTSDRSFVDRGSICSTSTLEQNDMMYRSSDPYQQHYNMDSQYAAGRFQRSGVSHPTWENSGIGPGQNNYRGNSRYR